MATEQTGFAARLRGGEPLFGTFVKTPTFHATEILGSVGYDFIVIDEEHAPINRESIEAMILAARARGVAALVRVGEPTDFNLMAQLDAGAAGVFVPHVNSVEKAERVAAACRYRGGGKRRRRGLRSGCFATEAAGAAFRAPAGQGITALSQPTGISPSRMPPRSAFQ